MIQRGASGGMVKGPTGKNAKSCGPCDCPPGLADAYSVNLSGTWSFAGCPGGTFACGGSPVGDFVLNGPAGLGCEFGINGGYGSCEVNVGGNSVNGLFMNWNQLDGGPRTWYIFIQFFTSEGSTDGPLVIYHKTDIVTCDSDPTGDFELFDAGCDSATVPSTLTVSDAP